MHASTNVRIQLAAVAAFIMLRLAVPGDVGAAVLVSLLGPVLVLAPAWLAGSPRVAPRVVGGARALFLLAPALLVAAAAVLPDTVGVVERVPVVALLSSGTPVPADTLAVCENAGLLLASAYVLAVLGLLSVVASPSDSKSPSVSR